MIAASFRCSALQS